MLGKAGSYSFFDHAADVGIRLRAGSLDELFATAGCALMEWIGPPPPNPERTEQLIVVTAEDRSELLVRWLQELLYRFHDAHGYFLGVKSIEFGPSDLTARAVISHWDEDWGRNFQEVKAVTYHRLQLGEQEGEWTASVILDI